MIDEDEDGEGWLADGSDAWTTGGDELVRWSELCEEGVERFNGGMATGSDDVDEDDEEDVGRWMTDLEFERLSSTSWAACC